MSKKVLVLSGGFSAEREVSLVSGQGVAEALKNGGYEVVCHDLKDTAEFIRALDAEKPDVVFNALHGNWGEDGEIQALLDILQVPYTHSGMLASARLIGQTSGAALVAMMFNFFGDRAPHSALLLGGCLALAGAVLSLLRLNTSLYN